MKDHFTLPNVCLPFQVVLGTLRNTTLTLFCLVTNIYRHLLFLFFLEKLSLGFFSESEREAKVSTGLLSPFFSCVFQLSESAG